MKVKTRRVGSMVEQTRGGITLTKPVLLASGEIQLIIVTPEGSAEVLMSRSEANGLADSLKALSRG